MASNATVVAPLSLSAFALSQECCNKDNAYRIAPIAQPNYTFLRLGNDHLIEPDILDHVDVHASVPAVLNSRLTDLGTGDSLDNRLGVYLHWTLPQFYRQGSSAAGSAATQKAQLERQRQQGFPPDQNADPTNADVTAAPQFRPVPNRWIVIRKIDKSDKLAPLDPPNAPISTFEAWVILSDVVRKLDDIDATNAEAVKNGALQADLEVDMSPFIDVDPSSVTDKDAQLLQGASEVFIGQKIKLDEWDDSKYDNPAHVKLNVMSSSNPLFADFTHQNMNVFSMNDNFAYPDPQDKNNTLYLKSAKADYFVLGFHSAPEDDPLTTTPTTDQNAKPVTNSDRLNQCNMVLKDASGDDTKLWLTLPAASRIVCHSAMYGVKYKSTQQPTNVLADHAGARLQEKQPISVGATPIDAVLAYCRAHEDRDSGNMLEIEKDLLKLEALLRGKENDDVDGLQAAADESLELSFQKTSAGTEWKFKEYTEPDTPPAVASSDQIKVLAVLNGIQTTLDSLERKISKKSWSLFAQWWNFVSNYFSDQKFVKPLVDALVLDLVGNGTDSKQRPGLTQLRDQTQKQRDALTTASPSLAKATPERFYQRKDPTLLFAGVGKGWEADFTDAVQVRLNSQIMTAANEIISGWDGAAAMFDKIKSKKHVPSAVQSTIRDLLSEFLNLRTDNISNTKAASKGKVVPWYHDEDNRVPGVAGQGNIQTLYKESRGRDMWQDTQPWQPLYIEWEANYYHIEFDKWTFDEQNRLSNWNAKVVSYGPKDALSGPFKAGTTPNPTDYDIRTIRGRNHLIPQGATSLKMLLQQVFENTNSHQLEEIYGIPADEQKNLLNIISDANIISFPLTGMTSQLITKFEGSHVKPLVRLPGQKSRVIAEASEGFKFIISNGDVDDAQTKMMLMDTNTNETPYGDIPVGETNEPFKPVTHGQLIFTRINIIDKFGQVISLDPKLPFPEKKLPTDPKVQAPDRQLVITPCISDAFFPGTVGDGDPKDDATRPNLIIAQPTNASCPFLSLVPAINQPARLNSEFLLRDKDTKVWRSCTDWDFAPDNNPIVGWFVVNYADQGLQIFLADGTFYREVRKGRRYKVKDPTKSKTTLPQKWLPFEEPNDLQARIRQGSVKQLDYLIDELRDETYFNAMIHMINQAMDPTQPGSTLPHPPKSYATYTSAIVGRPVALVNAGWSLELSEEENQNWSTIGDTYPGRRLLNAQTLGTMDGGQWEDTQEPSHSVDANMPTVGPLGQDTKEKGYYFNMKLGDKDRNFDGLLGYFLPRQTAAGSTDPDLNYKTIYTYFTEKAVENDPRTELNTTTYPIVTPYYLDPRARLSGGATPTQAQHDSKLRRYGLIIDPFLPVHAYTAILPNGKLQLPPYLVEQVLSNLTAFWRIGPILVAEDVPVFDWDNLLTGTYAGMLSPDAKTSKPQPIVGLSIAAPAAARGSDGASYRYLRPYWGTKPDSSATAKTATPTLPATHFNALSISADAASGGDSSQMKMLDGPYTMLEGYLQITKPIAGANAQT